MDADSSPTARCAFPLLRQFHRQISLQFFEQYTGKHFLNVTLSPVVTDDDGSSDPYAAGRWKAVAATLATAVLYFYFANQAFSHGASATPVNEAETGWRMRSLTFGSVVPRLVGRSLDPAPWCGTEQDDGVFNGAAVDNVPSAHRMPLSQR